MPTYDKPIFTLMRELTVLQRPITGRKHTYGPLGDETCGPLSEMSCEHEMREFLARNLNLVGHGLRIFNGRGGRGVGLPAGDRTIDILAIDGAGDFVVIGLQTEERLNYEVPDIVQCMNWVENKYATRGEHVRGVIVAQLISTGLRVACSRAEDVRLMEFRFSLSVTAV